MQWQPPLFSIGIAHHHRRHNPQKSDLFQGGRGEKRDPVRVSSPCDRADDGRSRDVLGVARRERPAAATISSMRQNGKCVCFSMGH